MQVQQQHELDGDVVDADGLLAGCPERGPRLLAKHEGIHIELCSRVQKAMGAGGLSFLDIHVPLYR